MIYFTHGALAQLGARHTGSVEVTGSNPVCSMYSMIKLNYFGALAQLGARYIRIVEATGSNPVCSIEKRPGNKGNLKALCKNRVPKILL